jgi:hypothetical protein
LVVGVVRTGEIGKFAEKLVAEDFFGREVPLD